MTNDREEEVTREQQRFLQALREGKAGEVIEEDNRRMDAAFDQWLKQEDEQNHEGVNEGGKEDVYVSEARTSRQGRDARIP